jgi:uncharacterized integral membrane protein
VTTPDPTARPVTPPAGALAPGSPGTGGPPVTRATAPPATSAARPGAPAPPRRRTRSVGLALAAALLVFVTVVLVLFVIFNTQSVRISLVFGVVDAPLVLALALAAVLGGLVVGLWSLVRRSRRSGRSGR